MLGEALSWAREGVRGVVAGSGMCASSNRSLIQMAVRGKGKDAGSALCVPTLRDETAKDGAPEHWLGDKRWNWEDGVPGLFKILWNYKS